jgi:hypothetical protein
MKRNKMNRLFAYILTALLTANLYAGESAGQAGAFLRIGLTPRAKGMGDTYVAIADNASAAYYNPAGLAFIRQPEIILSYSAMSFDRTFNHIGFSRRLPPMAGFAAGIIQSGFKDSEARLRNGELAGEKIEDTHYAFFIGFAVRFSDKFSIGISPKVIYSKVYDVSAKTFGADFGVMFKPIERLSIGAVIKDIGVKMKYTRDPNGQGDQTTTDAYPRIMKAGAAYQLPLSGSFKYVLFAADLEKNALQGMKSHFGVETNIQDKIYVRAGLDSKDFTAGFSVPFKIKQQSLQIDYAYIQDTRGFGGFGSQDLAIRFMF